MTPEEREVLEWLVPKMIWEETPVDNPFMWKSSGQKIITYVKNKYEVSPRWGEIFSEFYDNLDHAKEACRTHQLEQVRKIFGDVGMAKLMEMKFDHEHLEKIKQLNDERNKKILKHASFY